MALPIAISSFLTYPIFDTRYSFSASLALYLLAAKGVEVASGAFSRTFPRGTPRTLRSGTVWLVAVIVLAALSSGEFWTYFNTVNKEQWREAAQYMDAHVRPGDLVLVEGSRGTQELFAHYSTRTDVETERARSFYRKNKPMNIENYDKIWHVSVGGPTREAERLLDDSFFEETHSPIDHEEYVRVALTLYEKE